LEITLPIPVTDIGVIERIRLYLSENFNGTKIPEGQKIWDPKVAVDKPIIFPK